MQPIISRDTSSYSLTNDREEDELVSPLPKSSSPQKSDKKGLSIDLLVAPKNKTVLRRKSSGINYFMNSMKFEQEKKKPKK